MPNSEEKNDDPQWFESQSFWLDYAAVLFDEDRWSEAVDAAEKIVRLANLKPGDTVLDAGCGPGRIAVELAVLGMNVTGVDLIEPYLAAAAESAQAEAVAFEPVCADLRRFCRPHAFKAALSLYTSFGYCRTSEEDRQILRNIADSLQPGGCFILECVSRETALLHFTEGESFERGGFRVHTHFELLNDNRALLSRWDIENDTLRRSHTFSQRLYGASELIDILKELGFSQTRLYGNWRGASYDDNADTMILVAFKNESSPREIG